MDEGTAGSSGKSTTTRLGPPSSENLVAPLKTTDEHHAVFGDETRLRYKDVWFLTHSVAAADHSTVRAEANTAGGQKCVIMR